LSAIEEEVYVGGRKAPKRPFSIRRKTKHTTIVKTIRKTRKRKEENDKDVCSSRTSTPEL